MIATEGTVKGGAYVRAIQARIQAPVVQQACPLFVPMAEEGVTEGRSPRRWRTAISIRIGDNAAAARAGSGLHAFSRAEGRDRARRRPGRELVDSAATTADAVGTDS